MDAWPWILHRESSIYAIYLSIIDIIYIYTICVYIYIFLCHKSTRILCMTCTYLLHMISYLINSDVYCWTSIMCRPALKNQRMTIDARTMRWWFPDSVCLQELLTCAWSSHLQKVPRPMQGLLIIHVYQESKRSHIYKHILTFVVDTALNCTYRYAPPAELQKILPLPSGKTSGAQDLRILRPDKSKLDKSHTALGATLSLFSLVRRWSRRFREEAKFLQKSWAGFCYTCQEFTQIIQHFEKISRKFNPRQLLPSHPYYTTCLDSNASITLCIICAIIIQVSHACILSHLTWWWLLCSRLLGRSWIVHWAMPGWLVTTIESLEVFNLRVWDKTGFHKAIPARNKHDIKNIPWRRFFFISIHMKC